MATDKPHITVTLTPAQYDLLKQLGALNKQSMSAIVSELVEAVEPSLARALEVMLTALTASAEVRENLVRSMAVAEAQLMPQIQLAEKQYSAFMDEAAQLVAEGKDPRPVITGVR